MNIIWLILVLLFVVIEALTVNLVTIWGAIGALFAFIISYFTDSVSTQIIVFFIITIVSLILTRKIVKSKVDPKKIPTNLDSVVGKIGIVVSSIDKSTLRVKVMGKDWAAKSIDEGAIEEGKKVEILEIKGVKLIVKEVKK